MSFLKLSSIDSNVPKESLMELLAAWPEWLVWSAAATGALVAVTVIVSIIDATLDLESS